MAFVPPGPCPNCGEPVSRGARACPSCGSDEKSGWSDDTYLDGIDLPDDSDPGETDRIRDREFGSGRPRGWKAWLAAAVLVLLVAALIRQWVLW